MSHVLQDMEGMKRETTHSWIIVAASFLCLLFNPGINYAVGVLHIGLLETYPDDQPLIVWLGSMYGCMFALTGPVSSIVINMYNCRTCAVVAGLLGLVGFVGSYFVCSVPWLFLTYAFTVGLGQGLSYTASFVILGYYFEDDASLAAGIAMTGAGLGMFIYPVLCSTLLALYGLHGTFLILGAITLQSCVFAILMRPSQFELDRHHLFLSGRNKRQNVLHAMCGGDLFQFRTVLTNVPFTLFLASIMIFCLSLSSIYLYLPEYFLQHGATRQTASFSISMSGIGSIISRCLIGFAANDPQIGCLLLFAGMTGISGFIALFTSLFSLTTAGQLAYGFLLGLYSGGVWVVCGPVTLSILGVERLSVGYGLVMFTVGVGYLMGPPLSGNILKINNNYFSVFNFCATMCFLSTALCYCSTVVNSRLDKESQDLKTYDFELKLPLTVSQDVTTCDSDLKLPLTDTCITKCFSQENSYSVDKDLVESARTLMLNTEMNLLERIDSMYDERIQIDVSL